MKWLDKMTKWAQEAHHRDPTAPFRPSPGGEPPRGYELIHLPGGQFLAGRGDTWVSSTSPFNPPQIVHLDNGTRLWEHNDIFLSTVGITPRGNLDHCYGGGCQYRAFANATGGDINKIQDEYLDIAVDWGILDLDDKFEMWGGFTDVSEELIDDMAKSYKMRVRRLPLRPELEPTLQKVQNGIVVASEHSAGTHLVAVRDGKQVVPSISQMLEDYNKIEKAYYYPEWWAGRQQPPAVVKP